MKINIKQGHFQKKERKKETLLLTFYRKKILRSSIQPPHFIDVGTKAKERSSELSKASADARTQGS